MSTDQGFELGLSLGNGFSLIADYVYADIPAALGSGDLKAVDSLSQQAGAFLGVFVEHFLAKGHRFAGGDALAGGAADRAAQAFTF